MISDENPKLVPIADLVNENFVVPKYQRGYRWTKKEVEDLLKDLFQFFLDNQKSDEKAFYCLQPLVVSKSSDNLKVVDGQQRLTTIRLILTYLDDVMSMLGKSKYTLSYETRPGSEKYLDELNESDRLKSIDHYHMYEAYKVIENWFSEKDGSVKIAILNTILNDNVLGKNTRVIRYEVEDDHAADLFTRINMGKIPLTNSELIKALFLRKGNFKKSKKTEIRLQQIEIASDWDRIERKLQDNSFWFFINDNKTKYDTRIEFIFDLLMDKSPKDDEYYTFIEFHKKFEDDFKIDKIWLEVKEYFLRIEEWYNNKKLYHLIGFLLATGTKIPMLYNKAKDHTKEDFIRYITGEISKKFANIELDDIRYNDYRVKNILLLFNIETILQNPKSNTWFPFSEFKNENWDIEHISSVMSDMPSLGKSRKWLENLNDYLIGETVLDHYVKGDDVIDQLISDVQDLLASDDYTQEDFRSVYEDILMYFKEDYGEEDENGFTNHLGNLTLLDSYTNRSYKNAIFPVKRKRILKNDKEGNFVPICTKNVFLKYYSDNLREVMLWQKSDAVAYQASIRKTLEKYTNSESE